ncbi:MAG TPA: S8 family serine peptidase, partial [Puia sp.]|nr:S8 family serine peptidase [Puia sp.]
MNSTVAAERLVIKIHDDLKLAYHPDSELCDYFLKGQFMPFGKLLENFPGTSVRNLFSSVRPEKIEECIRRAVQSDPDYQSTRLLNYFAIDCSPEIHLQELLLSLSENKMIELAYRETGSFAPLVFEKSFYNAFTGQEYLDPSPWGINAKYAWRFKGGDGKGKVKFIDIEKGWIDHAAIKTGHYSDTGINQFAYGDHGAGVLGIIMMSPGDEGGIGITPEVQGYVMSQYRPDGILNTADAILTAISHLQFGDILLLEAQVTDFAGKGNLWPVEIQDAIWQVIRLATALGIIVIEAAGNGNLNGVEGNDLDLFHLNGKKILDPKDTAFKDSGAIMVAASTMSAPHRRMTFSNYGRRINCFASGENILTAGNHPGNSGCAINMYTSRFGGTSGAAAIITGAVISIQSIKEANNQTRFSPSEMRRLV